MFLLLFAPRKLTGLRHSRFGQAVVKDDRLFSHFIGEEGECNKRKVYTADNVSDGTSH
jgi:hypothetical protein